MHTKYEYYNNGLSSATVKKADDVSRTYKYFYYDDGQTESVKDPLEGVTSCTYDKDGNVETVTDPNGNKTESAEDVTLYQYDCMGRVVYERNAIGVETKSAYDAVGNIKKSVNGRKLETEYTYDDKGRLTGLKDAAGQIDYSYDANGNVTGVNGKTQEIKKTYDALNRVTSYTDYKGNTVSYGYDECSWFSRRKK